MEGVWTNIKWWGKGKVLSNYLPDNLILPIANCLVTYQGTVWITLSTQWSKHLQQQPVVRPRNPTFLIILYAIPKPISATLSKIPHWFEETTKEPPLDVLTKCEVKGSGCKRYYLPNNSLTLQYNPQSLYTHLQEISPYYTDLQDLCQTRAIS